MSLMYQRPIRLHLTHDEIVSFPYQPGPEIPYRMRIWQGSGDAPLVLISHIYDEGCMWPAPSEFSARIVNYISLAYLSKSQRFPLYYEDEVNPIGCRDLWRVNFELQHFGHIDRMRLYKPTRQHADWDEIEHFTRVPTER